MEGEVKNEIQFVKLDSFQKTTNILGSNVVMLHNIKEETYESNSTTTIDNVKNESGYRDTIIENVTHLEVMEPNADLKKYHNCKTCHKKFTVRKSLKRHMSIHTGEQPYDCWKCHKKFGHKDNYQRHLKIHEIDKVKLACNICNKKYSDKSSLQFHMKIHTSEKLFKCSECDKKYTHKVQLETHLKSKLHANQTLKIRNSTGTGAELEEGHECKICNKRFRDACYLIMHMEVHTGEKSYECNECHKKFTCEDSFQKHKRNHDKGKLCQICNKTFIKESSLKGHMKIHTGEDLFKCSECDKEYTRKDHLKRHLETHQKLKLKYHECKLCNKKIKNISYLKIHMRIHMSEKRFECSECQKKFTFRNELHQHMKIHKTERKISDNSSETITRSAQDDLLGEIRCNSNNIKIEKIDLDQKTIPEYINLQKYKFNIEEIASSNLPYTSCFGETICKEEVILPDENI